MIVSCPKGFNRGPNGRCRRAFDKGGRPHAHPHSTPRVPLPDWRRGGNSLQAPRKITIPIGREDCIDNCEYVLQDSIGCFTCQSGGLNCTCVDLTANCGGGVGSDEWWSCQGWADQCLCYWTGLSYGQCISDCLSWNGGGGGGTAPGGNWSPGGAGRWQRGGRIRKPRRKRRR